MMKNVRITDNVYTVPVNIQQGVINNASTPIFFSGYPYLLKKKVKAIGVDPANINMIAGDPYFLTLIDSNGNQLLYNWPIWDLVVTSQGVNRNRLRYFDLYDIDLSRSYWLNALNVGWASTTTLYRINFYF